MNILRNEPVVKPVTVKLSRKELKLIYLSYYYWKIQIRINQPGHHRSVTFAEEYDSVMKFYQKRCNLLRNFRQTEIIRF